jgi:hypothetical protein
MLIQASDDEKDRLATTLVSIRWPMIFQYFT